MILGDYLTTVGKTVADFAAEIGVHPNSLHRYMRGARLPKKKILRKISQATDGAVTANDFVTTDHEAEAA
jgi:transcriptional regulator with XRE-family HTH domain